MKPAPFEYIAPATLDEALEALASYGYEAKLLAGGQSLIPVMNFRLAQPGVLIDLNGVKELDFLHTDHTGGVRIGAMTRHSRLENSNLVRHRAPLLSEVMPQIAHPQIRNRGTMGGSLAHADPAAELPVITVALGARFRLQRQGGERWIDADGPTTEEIEVAAVQALAMIAGPGERLWRRYAEVLRAVGWPKQRGAALHAIRGMGKAAAPMIPELLALADEGVLAEADVMHTLTAIGVRESGKHCWQRLKNGQKTKGCPG